MLSCVVLICPHLKKKQKQKTATLKGSVTFALLGKNFICLMVLEELTTKLN